MMDICGIDLAGRLYGELLTAYRHRLPDDLAIYRRAIVPILAAATPERARAVVRRAHVLGGLPSRAEILAVCRAPLSEG